MQTPATNQVGRSLRILIAVVQPHYAETLRISLETRGIEVVGTTTTSKEAIWLTRNEQPDIVLIDLGLQDGLTIGKGILAEHPQTKVIALSSRFRDSLMLETIRAGFHGYFMKDISPEELTDDLMVIAQPRPHQAGKRARKTASRAPGEPRLTDREREVLARLIEEMPPRKSRWKTWWQWARRRGT